MQKYIVLVALLFLTALLFISLWRKKLKWTDRTSSLIDTANNTSSTTKSSRNLEELHNLPEIVKTYFNLVLPVGSPIINRAYISQEGKFRANPDLDKWSLMQAEQFFTTQPRAFVWNARITVFFRITINIVDTYHRGKGEIYGKLLSLFTVLHDSNKSPLNEASLQRFLAESVWFPSALLPSQGVHWEEIDRHKARASITDSGITTSLDFEFNDIGEIISVYTPSRYREVSGQYKATPWKGWFSDYKNIDGYLIPQKAEVEWHLDHQTYTYWKARLTKTRFE